jgi:hypothetical protein
MTPFFHCPIATLSFGQIDATKPIPEVFEDVKAIFAPYAPKVSSCFHRFSVCSFAHVTLLDDYFCFYLL